MDADKVEVSTETKSERRKGKKRYKFRWVKVPSPRWESNLRRSKISVNLIVSMQFNNLKLHSLSNSRGGLVVEPSCAGRPILDRLSGKLEKFVHIQGL